MGWMASWVAVQGGLKAEIFDHLGLTETGEETFPGSRGAPLSFREFPDQWLVIFSEDFDWASAEVLLELSRFGLALACQFEDKVEMTTVLSAARDGATLWRVFHDNVGSGHRLDVTGEPPAAFAAIRDAALAEQRQADANGEDVDFLCEAPLELARAVCGYRPDEEEAAFTVLRRRGASAPADGGGQLSFLERLLAPFRSKGSPAS